MQRNITWRYALVVMTYWIGFATISAFSSLYLLDIGFSNTAIGILLAISGVVSAVMQPIVSTWAEKPNSPSLKKITCLLAGTIIVSAVLVRLVAPLGMLLSGLLYGCTIMLLQTLQPMVNAIGMESINRGDKMNFGISRAFGSVGYAAVSYTMGYLAARFTPGIIPIFGAVFFGLFILTVVLYPQQKAKGTAILRADRGGVGVVSFFKKYKRFGIVLIGCTLLFTSHSLVNTFNLQIVLSKGGTSVEMGIATAIAACIEIPGMILFATLAKKFRCDTLLEASGVFFMLKCLGSLLAPSMAVYYAVQICQLFGWGLFAVATVRYTNSVMEPQDTIKGQGYTTVVQSLGSVLGTTIGGRMMDVLGVNAMLLFGICTAAIGTVVIVLSAQKVMLENA